MDRNNQSDYLYVYSQLKILYDNFMLGHSVEDFYDEDLNTITKDQENALNCLKNLLIEANKTKE